MANRLAVKIGIALAIGLAVVLFRVAIGFYSSPRFTSKATTVVILLARYGGIV